MISFFRPLARKSQLIVTSLNHQVYFRLLKKRSENWTYVESMDLIYLLQGDAEVEIQGQKINWIPGQLLLLTKGACYRINKKLSENCRYLQISYSRSSPLSLRDEHSLNVFEVDCDLLKGFIASSGREILSAVEQDDVARSFKKSIFAEIHDRILQFFDADFLCLESQLKPLKNRSWLLDVLGHFEKEISTANILKKTAIQFEMSREHFSRKFKKITQLAPIHFFKLMKLRNSQFQLPSSKKIYDVSFDLGFSDQSHFNKAFKQHLQMSPSDFKKVINQPLEI